jgi:hypothetical protein
LTKQQETSSYYASADEQSADEQQQHSRYAPLDTFQVLFEVRQVHFDVRKTHVDLGVIAHNRSGACLLVGRAHVPESVIKFRDDSRHGRRRYPRIVAPHSGFTSATAPGAKAPMVGKNRITHVVDTG